MNPILALTTIIQSVRQHPWLLVFVALAIASHAGAMQFQSYHNSLEWAARAFMGVAVVYSGGAMVNPLNSKPSTDKPKQNEKTPPNTGSVSQ
jgi:hypothetical protein